MFSSSYHPSCLSDGEEEQVDGEQEEGEEGEDEEQQLHVSLL